MAEIESEGELPRSDIASFLRDFADELDPESSRGEPADAEPSDDRADETRIRERDAGRADAPSGDERTDGRSGDEESADVRTDEETETIDRDEAIDRTWNDDVDEGAHEGEGPDVSEGADDDERPETMTLIVGSDSATVTLPESVEFEVEVESRSPLLSSGVEQSIEFGLSWAVEEASDDDSLEVI